MTLNTAEDNERVRREVLAGSHDMGNNDTVTISVKIEERNLVGHLLNTAETETTQKLKGRISSKAFKAMVHALAQQLLDERGLRLFMAGREYRLARDRVDTALTNGAPASVVGDRQRQADCAAAYAALIDQGKA